MISQLKIFCKNIVEYIPLNWGETLLELAERLAPQLNGLRPICAYVNNKTEPLHYQVFGPKQVEFLGSHTPSGQRVYIRSLCMMLYCAVKHEFPEMRLRIEHSIAGGYYCRLFKGESVENPHTDAPGVEQIPAIVDRLRETMRSLCLRDVEFERKERLTSDIIGKFRDAGQPDKVQLLETTHELYTTYYRLDGVIDSYYGALAPSTGILDVFDLVPYKEGFLLMGFDRTNHDVPQQKITQEKMYAAYVDYLHFNNVIGIANVGQLNKAV